MLFDAERARALTLADPIDEAVYRTLLYADLFDFPLTREETHRLLIAPSADRMDVDRAVDRALRDGRWLRSHGGYLCLAGREETILLRRRRSALAQAQWMRAGVYARLIWRLPFVRMVAVTGALAVDNVEPGGDIDFLIATEPGRLWTVRGMIVLLCRLARLQGDVLCPNYLVTTGALTLDPANLYTAHELAQMRPLHGRQVVEAIWSQNGWYRRFLGNARCDTAGVRDSIGKPALLWKRLGEALLRLPPGDALENWERKRKIRMLTRREDPNAESAYGPDICKGHVHGHGERTLRLFAARLGGDG